MPLMLKPQHKKILDAVLIQYPYQYFAFGSRVTGKAKDYSDLDLCIMNEISIEEFGILKEHVSAQPLPFSVDLVVWGRCSSEFKHAIQANLVPYIPDLYLGAEIISLHHTIIKNMPTWNGTCGFSLEIKNDHENLFRIHHISIDAGIGTHIDAPAHILKNGTTILDFEQKHTFAWCYIWRPKNPVNNSTIIRLEDLMLLEQEYGPLAPGSWIIFMTGWGKRFYDGQSYRNLDKNNIMQFPTLCERTTDFFIQRKIAGIGIDTLSPDSAASAFPVHRALLSAGIHIIENIAYRETVQNIGYLLINPLPATEITESPVRLLFVQQKKS
jgi:kynurenine formamidase/predicted nucleotidyltransferase